MTDAEIIQLGSRGPAGRGSQAGRGSRGTPSAAARGLAPVRASRPARSRDADAPVVEATAPERTRSAAEKPAAKKPTTKKPTPQKPTTKKPAAKKPTPQKPAATKPAPVEPASSGSENLESEDVGGGPPADDAPVGDPTEPQSGPSEGDQQESPPRASVPGFDLQSLLAELGSMAGQALEGLKAAPVEQLRSFATDPLRGVLQLAESLGVDWQGSVDDVVDFARSRLRGDYAVDEFGFDPEFTTKVFLPLLRPLVQSWFRVEVRGLENIPTSGSALLVSNHAGTMPLDGMVLHTVIYDELARHVRMLGADLIFSTPYSHDLARKTGTTLACQEDAERLLAADQLVAVFPEGFKGLGKPYADRYKLQRFGRGGFVSAAVRAQVPIIPVSIVGSEEIYPLISTAPTLARAMGVPYFPVTPLFPWLGALGMIPLPSKWIIQFGEAITTDELSPGAADDPMIVFNVTDQVRETIQHTLYALLMQRRSVFF